MKVIGLIGGMSWESSLEYYRLVNQGVRDRLGPLASARVLMYSVNFEELEAMMRQGNWSEVEPVLGDAAERLERGGADFFLICTNTMHKVADQVAQRVSIPLIHIGDATGREVKARGLERVGLLGTIFTMEQPFLKNYLLDRFDIETVIPDKAGREEVNRIIFDELCQGRILEESRQLLVNVIRDLTDQGAQGVVLGCTELPLLVKPEDTDIPLFDTTAIHAAQAVRTALQVAD
jgi:aspartate racemase